MTRPATAQTRAMYARIIADFSAAHELTGPQSVRAIMLLAQASLEMGGLPTDLTTAAAGFAACVRRGEPC